MFQKISFLIEGYDMDSPDEYVTKTLLAAGYLDDVWVRSGPPKEDDGCRIIRQDGERERVRVLGGIYFCNLVYDGRLLAVPAHRCELLAEFRLEVPEVDVTDIIENGGSHGIA